jgi:hypothetical protein
MAETLDVKQGTLAFMILRRWGSGWVPNQCMKLTSRLAALAASSATQYC